MELSISELTQLTDRATADPGTESDPWIGKYVIVRCRDAGVHAGKLVSRHHRTCELTEARRLWHWKPKRGAFLSAIAATGLHNSSKVGTPVDIVLTENCEIILATEEAEESIRGQRDYEHGS